MSEFAQLHSFLLENDKHARRKLALIRKEFQRFKQEDPTFHIPCPMCKAPLRLCVRCAVVVCVAKNCSYTGCHESTNLEKI